MLARRFKLGLFFAALALQELVSHWYLAQKLMRNPPRDGLQGPKLVAMRINRLKQSSGSLSVQYGLPLPKVIDRAAVAAPTRPTIDLDSIVAEGLDDEYNDAYIQNIEDIPSAAAEDDDEHEQIEGVEVIASPDDMGDWPIPFEAALSPAPHLPMPAPSTEISTGARKMHKMIVLVLSRREMFDTRQVIRETWAQGHDNVYFVLGACCPIPLKRRKRWTCDLNVSQPSASEQTAWDGICRAVDQRLAKEQSQHGDLIRVGAVDVYRNLPQKVKEGYAWVVCNTTAEWVVKTDDDSVVRVGTLEHYLTTTYDARKPVVVGSIMNRLAVDRKGKWAELTYTKRNYPKFPLGSHGHCVSRSVATWIVEHKDDLFNYQGEDVSVGIWLDESPLKNRVQWVTSKHIAGNGRCKDPRKWMIGHNINTSKMRQCFQQMDESLHVKMGATWNVTTVSPRVLSIANRFDIVVKTVYAIFLHRGKVPSYVQSMYDRHLEVWKNFKESCTFAGEKDWFDATKPCVKKSSAKDFQRHFSKLLRSIATDGFDNQRSLVPVTSVGFPLNGAHRIAAAIALEFPTMPIQQVSSTEVYNWDSGFFTSKGFEEEYADFAMLQWTLHVSNVRTIIFWPETASSPEKMKLARSMAQQHCGDVLYEKPVDINQKGVASLALHVYGNRSGMPEHIKQLQSTFKGQDDDKRPISILFVRPKSLLHLKSCKDKLKSYFALARSSVHIPIQHAEAVVVAEMVLNPNSVLFLNRHDGDTCQAVASELATLLKLSPENSASFVSPPALQEVHLQAGTKVYPKTLVFPQDIMVDSGIVMSFFGLRKGGADVDLVFFEMTRANVLGRRRGDLVETNGHTHFKIRRHSSSELFFDPSNYGYCHGLKFASLQQLRQYKTERGSKGKGQLFNEDDVDAIDAFLDVGRQPVEAEAVAEKRNIKIGKKTGVEASEAGNTHDDRKVMADSDRGGDSARQRSSGEVSDAKKAHDNTNVNAPGPSLPAMRLSVERKALHRGRRQGHRSNAISAATLVEEKSRRKEMTGYNSQNKEGEGNGEEVDTRGWGE